MTSTTLEPAAVPAVAARARLSLGGRAVEARAAASRRRIRRDGRHADVGERPRALRRRLLAAWPPRDGAETGPVRRASLREMQQVRRSGAATVRARRRRHAALNSGGYGFGLGVSADCLFAHIVVAQRRTARIRLADALAARARRRHHRVRQSDLYRLGRADRPRRWR